MAEGDPLLIQVVEQENGANQHEVNVEEDMRPETDQHEQQVSKWLIKAAYILVATLLASMSVVRTALRITKSRYLEKSAHIFQNTSRFTADYCSTELLTPGGYYRFTSIIYDVLSGLHCIEVLLIVFGVYHFHTYTRKMDLIKQVNEHLKCNTSVVPLGILGIIYFLVAFATPALNIYYASGTCTHQADLSCNTWNERIFRITVAHESLTLFFRPIFILIRVSMIFAVVAVYIIWFKFDQLHVRDYREPEIANPDASEYCKAQWKTASSTYYKYSYRYEKRREMVVPILEIYQEWFVIQWFIYYIALFTDVTTLLKPLVANSEDTLSTCSFVQIGLHIGYTVVAFGIPYACGLKMSVYHTEFYNDEVREQHHQSAQEHLHVSAQRDPENVMQYALAHILTIKKDKECNFVPHIKWTGSGISIPIDGPGFTIVSLFTIFAFSTAIVGFS